MLLKQVKKISLEEAQFLRITGEKIKALSSLKDSAFLCQALALDPTNLNRTERWRPSKQFEVSKPFGSFTKLEYELAPEFYKFAYRKARWGEGIKELNFTLSQPTGTAAEWNENIPCVLVSIDTSEQGTSKKTNRVFSLGLYYEEKNKARLNAVAERGNILKLAQFFYCRRALYEQVHEVLLENRQAFENLSNSFFVEALITLFSVTNAEAKGQTFKLPLTNVKEQYYKTSPGRKNSLFLGAALFYPAASFFEKATLPVYASELRLAGQTQLLIETRATSGIKKEAQTRILAAAENKEFQTFLTRINDWVEQTVAMVAFAYAIYEKVKGKILLENI